ncbi:unnamed protein product [Sphagnum troendelagicum]|uniref:Phytocyanin domain-containing protein n=1 Tax=Sphagnum troendelagicum TaxID=128251 RepID=A0ABP0UA12_9BRYO
MGASVVVQGRSSAVVTHVVMMILALLGLMALLQGAQAETYLVGGTTQEWGYPPSDGANYYSDVWAKGITFRVGDVLQFMYNAESHNVYQLPNETAYANCDFSSPIASKFSGNDSFSLTSVGDVYYACGVPTHCANYGMKLSIQVVAASGSPPPASPPTAPAPTTPPTAPAPAPATPPPAPATPPTAPATPPTAPAPAPATPPPAPATAPTAPAPATPPPTAPAPATPPTGPISSPGTPPASSPSPVSSASRVQSLTPLVAAALLTAAAIFLF